MKKTHIVLLILIAISVALIIGLVGDASTKATFSSRQTLNGQEVTIAGSLVKDEPVEYDPEKNPNSFTFYLADADGEKKKVIMNKAMELHFEKVDKVTITGAMKDDVFYASEYLAKCPSKYEDKDTAIQEANTN